MKKFSVIYNAIGMKEEIFNEKENADLFADALNTLKECEWIPSEILKQRDDLLAFIEQADFTNDYDIKMSKAILNKTTS
jgi:hypothetical protein